MEDEVMRDAVKEVLLQFLSERPEADSLSNELLGQRVRAMIEGERIVEGAWKRLEEFQDVPKSSDERINPAL